MRELVYEVLDEQGRPVGDHVTKAVQILVADEQVSWGSTPRKNDLLEHYVVDQ